ncbi:MAG TPA: tripartite tricarboxylate transporter substrate binding protein, partial [Beijerinckiaceae bacterium]
MIRTALTAAAVLAAACAGAQAQGKFPERPVTMVVSQAAGASPDVMARLLSERVGRELNQSLVVENKPGAGNVIGATAVARAAPDGYTIFFATSAALATNPYMMKNLPYDPVKDFAPVALVARSVQAIVANPALPAQTLGELIKMDKAKDGSLSIAVDGPRNLAGVTAQALNKRADIKLLSVPYPNINNGIQDVLNGRVEIGVFSVSTVETHIRSGGLKALA